MEVVNCNDWRRQGALRWRPSEVGETAAAADAAVGLPVHVAAGAEAAAANIVVPAVASSTVAAGGICARYCPGRCLKKE